MYRRLIEAVLLAGLRLATAGTAAAQQPQHPSAQPSIMNDEARHARIARNRPSRHARQTAAPAFEHDPDLDADDQLAPSQMLQPMPGAVAMPDTAATRVPATAEQTMPGKHARAGRLTLRTAAPYRRACSGVFGRDSSHAKLAMAFRSRNVTFTQVDAASGGKTMASVLFAKEPKRRLEVWWSKPANRSDTHLIVINGTVGLDRARRTSARAHARRT